MYVCMSFLSYLIILDYLNKNVRINPLINKIYKFIVLLFSNDLKIFLFLGNSDSLPSGSRTGAPEGQTAPVLTLISLCQTIQRTEHTQAAASLSLSQVVSSPPPSSFSIFTMNDNQAPTCEARHTPFRGTPFC